MSKNVEVLSIYFLGTTFDINDSLSSKYTRGYEDLVGALFKINHSEMITLESNDRNRKIKNEEAAQLFQSIAFTPNHYKMIVKGVGSDNENSIFTNLKEQLKQGTGDGLKRRVNRTLEAIDNLISQKKEQSSFTSHLIQEKRQIKIVNLFGFSRGAITAIEVANELVKINEILSINIFSIDPVYGSQISKTASRYQLVDSSKIKTFVGIYAIHEQSLYFDAVIPFHYQSIFEKSTPKKFRLFFLPGLHETLIGNSNQYWKKTLKPLMNQDQGNKIKPISEFIANLAILFSKIWRIQMQPFSKINGFNIDHFKLDYVDLNRSLIDICSSKEISEIMEQVAPKAQFVPNPGALFPKKYIFSDGHGRTISEIVIKYHKNLTNDYKAYLNNFTTSYNLESLKNIFHNNPKPSLTRTNAIKKSHVATNLTETLSRDRHQ